MGYANIRPRPSSGNSRGSVLKPVKNSHRWLWVAGLLLLVISTLSLCMVYIRDTKNKRSGRMYQHDIERAAPAEGGQLSEFEEMERDVRKTVQNIKRLPPKTRERMLHEFLYGLNRLGLSQEELKMVERIVQDELRR